jgi:histidinol-phosphate aminotransferase
MKYWNSTLRNMDEYIPGEQPSDLDTYIKLNSNENAFPPSKAALAAIIAEASEKLKRYPSSSAMEVRQIFAEDNGISPENVFMGNGSDEIFTLIFRGFIEKDGLAAFPYPSYSLYDTLAQGNGIAFEKVPLNKDFSYDLKKFLKKKYDLVIIANPNNPTGTYCPMEEIADFCRAYKGLMVVDEAYVDFYGGSAIDLIKEFDNLIVTRSFSKSYSLAGLRAGLAIAHRDIIRGFIKIKDSYNIDRLALAGTAAALKDKKTFRYNLEMTLNNKEYLEERLTEMGFHIVPSRANFLFVKHDRVPAEKIYLGLKEKKILIRHFRGDIQSEYVRITVGTMMEMKTLCREIETIIGSA